MREQGQHYPKHWSLFEIPYARDSREGKKTGLTVLYDLCFFVQQIPVRALVDADVPVW